MTPGWFGNHKQLSVDREEGVKMKRTCSTIDPSISWKKSFRNSPIFFHRGHYCLIMQMARKEAAETTSWIYIQARRLKVYLHIPLMHTFSELWCVFEEFTLVVTSLRTQCNAVNTSLRLSRCVWLIQSGSSQMFIRLYNKLCVGS